jgi:hypothetical protein
MLGPLRKRLGTSGGKPVRIRAGDLSDLSPGQLLRHPALQD